MDRQKYLQFHEKENDLFMPNEIFTDLQKHIKKSIHIPFAYAYYYLVSWLYRYTKYGSVPITNSEIKEVLGYSPTYTEINYLIKKNGLFDQIGYTETVKDFPLWWTFDGELEFGMLTEQEHQEDYLIGRSRKYTVKYPIKAFHRTVKNQEELDLDGTFYFVDNTHLIPFDVFLFCMEKREVGVSGFYLWSYLKMKHQQHENGYDVNLNDLAAEVGLAKRTMMSYLKELKKYNMIQCTYNQDYFSLAMEEEERKANTYRVNDYDDFYEKPQSIQHLKVISKEQYQQMKEDKGASQQLHELFG